ncbi:hypothetical protein IKE98_01970 [Candidatus Saccharibacteria bacterium]|nr:hypothetical protein [Candidatus Saccharibacteria bacterium]
MKEVKTNRRLTRSSLNKMSYEELIQQWAFYASKICNDPNNKKLHKNIGLIRARIDRFEDQKPFLEKVEDLGVKGVITPWGIVFEFLFYELNRFGDKDKELLRHIRQNDLERYIHDYIMPLISEKTRQLITDSTIHDVATELKAPVLKYYQNKEVRVF